MPLLRKAPGGPYALPVAMAGVRLGERVLVVGAGDPKMLVAIAAKSGLTGHAAAVVESAEEAHRLAAAAARAGLLLDVTVVSNWTGSRLDGPPFDVAIVDHTSAHVGSGSAGTRPACLEWVFRSLRTGGRTIVIERRPSGLAGFLGMLRPAAAAGAGSDSATPELENAGFRPVRVLADRGGWRFVEGLRSR